VYVYESQKTKQTKNLGGPWAAAGQVNCSCCWPLDGGGGGVRRLCLKCLSILSLPLPISNQGEGSASPLHCPLRDLPVPLSIILVQNPGRALVHLDLLSSDRWISSVNRSHPFWIEAQREPARRC